MTKQKPYHHGNLESALVAAAIALISKRGVMGFSLRETASLVGVSPSAAYRHFSSKEDLLTAVAREGFCRLGHDMQMNMDEARNRYPEKSALAAFEALGFTYVSFAIDNPAYFQVMFGIPLKELDPVSHSPYALLQNALDDLATTGFLDPEQRAGAELYAWSMVHGLACLMSSGSLPASGKEQIFLSLVPRILEGLKTSGDTHLMGEFSIESVNYGGEFLVCG